MRKITFTNRHKFIDGPAPAASLIPEWYKNSPKFPRADDPYFVGVKSCVPFLDSIMSGYMVTTPCDIMVSQKENGPNFNWKIGWDPISYRQPDALRGLPIPHGYSKDVFAWAFPHVMKADPRVSFIVTHPFNRYDLPFITTSGVVDMTGVLDSGHLPFFIQEGFEGVIPKGTPYAQIVPFIRSDWQLAEDAKLSEAGDRVNYLTNSKVYGYYRDNVWVKKIYKLINKEQ